MVSTQVMKEKVCDAGNKATRRPSLEKKGLQKGGKGLGHQTESALKDETGKKNRTRPSAGLIETLEGRQASRKNSTTTKKRRAGASKNRFCP